MDTVCPAFLYQICVQTDALEGYSLYPNDTVVIGCAAGKTELPSLIMYLRLLRGHLCSKLYLSRTWLYRPCYQLSEPQ